MRGRKNKKKKIKAPIVARNYPNPMQYLKKEFGLTLISGAEVGVAYGRTSLKLIEALNIKKLYLIDIWEEYQLHRKVTKGYRPCRIDFSEAHNVVLHLCKGNDALQMIKMDSVQASEWFPDYSLDFVFIDGNHDYEYVSKDVHAWFPKVRGGGIVCGHDYCSQWEGVVRAVDEFAEEHGLDLVTDEDWNWMMKKRII